MVSSKASGLGLRAIPKVRKAASCNLGRASLRHVATKKNMETTARPAYWSLVGNKGILSR